MFIISSITAKTPSKGSKDACIIILKPVKDIAYTNKIFVKITFSNNTEKTVRILKPFNTKGVYLNTLWFNCRKLVDNKILSSSKVINKTNSNLNEKLFEYVPLAPKESFSMILNISKLLKPKLPPGQYVISLIYNNEYGMNCIKEPLQSNELLLKIIEQDEAMKPSYISKTEAHKIAKKAHKMNYDKSIPPLITLQDGIYTVTFRVKLPKGVRGPNYAAQVKIDAKTGKVVEVLAGR